MNVSIVIVVYKQLIEECKTFKTLMSHRDKLKNVQITIYDNSPEKQEFNEKVYEGLSLSYIHDSRNLGISTAYNFAFNRAKESGCEWLLLFDHDTEITDEYIEKVMNINKVEEDIVAVVPKIYSKNKLISPVFSDSVRPLQVEQPKEGVQNKPVMAINSGALLRISFLTDIGGFNKQFPLDYLDHWLFYMVYANGYKVLLIDESLEHDLSIMDYSNISLGRYRSILDSEILFYKNYKTDLFPSYKKQLVKRLIKQFLVVRNKKIAAYTLSRLFSL
ncbi:glycosyltransferase [Bacillus sp. 1P02SD]|uniref:glycosyltransferase n=1 Tax=Bacillus sp. 1P02SD TaxID=3132264 RepID=UPI0039A3E76E